MCLHHTWLKVSQCAFHSIHVSSMMVTCLSVRWLFLVLSPFSFSPTSTFFSFNVYPFSVRHTIFNVDTAEDWNHCTHAQWGGVLPRDDIQSSHRLWKSCTPFVRVSSFMARHRSCHRQIFSAHDHICARAFRYIKLKSSWYDTGGYSWWLDNISEWASGLPSTETICTELMVFSIQSWRTDSFKVKWKAREDGRLSFSHHLSFWWRFRWRKNPWWSHSSSKSALSQSLETQSRCRFLGKIIQSTRSRIAILANEVTCNHRALSGVRRLHL